METINFHKKSQYFSQVTTTALIVNNYLIKRCCRNESKRKKTENTTEIEFKVSKIMCNTNKRNESRVWPKSKQIRSTTNW